MLSPAKQVTNPLFGRMGAEVRWKTSGFHADPYEDQAILMEGRGVDVILDAGANIGGTCLQYSGRFPGATIHAFEPSEGSYRRLVENCRSTPRIRPRRPAIADAVGQRRSHANKDALTNSVPPVAAGFIDAERTETMASIDVPTTTIPDSCAGEKINHVTMLEPDIQGGELAALRATGNLLGSRKIDLISTEVHSAERYAGRASFLDICLFLEPLRYTLYGLYDLNYGRRAGILAWGDAIFISPEVYEDLTGSPRRRDGSVYPCES